MEIQFYIMRCFKIFFSPDFFKVILVPEGFDMNRLNGKNRSPIQCLFEHYDHGVSEDLVDLFKEKGANLDILTEEEENLLHLSIRNKNPVVSRVFSKWILKNSPNIDQLRNMDGKYPSEIYAELNNSTKEAFTESLND